MQWLRVAPGQLVAGAQHALNQGTSEQKQSLYQLFLRPAIVGHIRSDDSALKNLIQTLLSRYDPADIVARTELLGPYLGKLAGPLAQQSQEQISVLADDVLRNDQFDRTTRQQVCRNILKAATQLDLDPRVAARLVYWELLDDAQAALQNHFAIRWFGAEFTYANAWHQAARERMSYFAAAWIETVNDRLSKGERHPAVFTSIDYVLRTYFDGDDWDVDKTATLLTKELERFYIDTAVKCTSTALQNFC